MKIGEVSDKLGMPASTIRYYEQIGLIETQLRVSGRRVFDSRALFLLQFVRLSQSAGFTIAEIKTLLESYVSDPSRNGDWITHAENKRIKIKEQISELEQMEVILTELLSCNCSSLTECIQSGMRRNGKS